MEAIVPCDAWFKYYGTVEEHLPDLTQIEVFLEDDTVAIKGFNNEEEIAYFIMKYCD